MDPENHHSENSVIELLEKVLRRQDKAEQLQQELNTYVLAARSDIRDIKRDQHDQDLLLQEILDSIGSPSTGFTLSQLQNGGLMAISGVQAGGSGTFQESPAPAGSLGLQAGSIPTYSVDDPAVTLSGSPDGDVTKVVASVPATDTGASFNLTVSGTNTAGTAISSVFNIPILPAAAAVSTGFTLNQL